MFFIACVDGLKGFPEAIESVYPRTEVQLCIVHLVRASLNYVNWKQRKEVAGDLRLIYQASTVSEAEMQRDDFARKWDATYPMVSQTWRRNWERITPFFAYPGEIRKVIYTTNTYRHLIFAKYGSVQALFSGILFLNLFAAVTRRCIRVRE